MNLSNSFARTFAATAQLFAMACILTSPLHAAEVDQKQDFLDPFPQSFMNNCKRTVDPDAIIPHFGNALMDCARGGNDANPICVGKGCIRRDLMDNGCLECAYDESLSWFLFPCDPVAPSRRFLLRWMEYSKPCVFVRDGYSGGDCECNENPDNERGPFLKSRQCPGAVCDQTCTF